MLLAPMFRSMRRHARLQQVIGEVKCDALLVLVPVPVPVLAALSVIILTILITLCMHPCLPVQ